MGKHQSLQTHCKRGHEFTPENTKLKTYKGSTMRRCIACHSAAVKAWWKAHPELRAAKKRRYHFRKMYGITLQQRADILTTQGGCAICKCTKPTGFGVTGRAGGWHVDHDHATGNIRGILCARCNLLLGMLKEDQNFITQISNYLKI